jgi:isoleucyl-tRNA synthetase
MLGKSILVKLGKSDDNESVLHELRVRKDLVHQENFHHSYPHCWRSKTPIIFRAMDQWFIKIDHVIPKPTVRGSEVHKQMDDLVAASERNAPPAELKAILNHWPTASFREIAIEAIDDVKWVPDWGVNRIKSAVESRPDWCISRQRTWGVPIPAFYDAQGNPLLDARIVRAAAALIQQHGSNIWFETTAAELWKLLRPTDWTGPEAVAKSSDTLDVWIDSGSSSHCVIAQRPEIRGDHSTDPASRIRYPAFQCDLYLEGSDQHRGWFQSSLLLSLAGNGAAPYRTVLTHGFMVDADREKISKSKQGQGAYEKPQTADAYVKKYGADVVRLWVASQDFRSDIVVSEERINKVGETYRGIRNALRYQLSNLYDFTPAQHAVPDDKLTGLDRWVLGEFAKLEQEVLAAYDRHEFHVVYQKLSQFVAVELSSIYHDVIKDRLYTDPANSARRRSTQTALRRLVLGLCQMLAPILAFTADEAWQFIPGRTNESVHLALLPGAGFALPDAEQDAWKSLFVLRELALPSLEKTRQAKTIGKALEAKITVTGSGPLMVDGQANLESLRELLNVSQLQFQEEAGAAVTTEVNRADGQKCERCWHWETDIGSNAEHPTICGRCVEAVSG